MTTPAPSAAPIKVRIRPALESDIPAVQEIYAYYVSKTTASFEDDPPTVAEMTARWQRITSQSDGSAFHAMGLQLFERMEQHLQQRHWLVGDAPTIADVAMYSYTARAPEGGIPLEPYPQLRAWLQRIEALPGFVPMAVTPAPITAKAA